MKRLCNLSLKRKMAMAFCAFLGCVLLSIGAVLPSLYNGNAFAENSAGQITSDSESAGGGASEIPVAKPHRAYTTLTAELNADAVIYAEFTTIAGLKQNLTVIGTTADGEFVLEPEEYIIAINGTARADSYNFPSDDFKEFETDDSIKLSTVSVRCGSIDSEPLSPVTVVKKEALKQYAKLRIAPVTETVSDDHTPQTLKKVLKVYGTYTKTEEDGTSKEVEELIVNRELYNVSFAWNSLIADTDNIVTVAFVNECGGAFGTVIVRPTFATLQSVSVAVNPDYTQDTAGNYKTPSDYSGFVAGMTQQEVFAGLVITAHYPNSRRDLTLFFDDIGALQGGANTQTGETVNTDSRNFAAGPNTLNLTVIGQKGTQKTASITIPFEERTVVAIEVSEKWKQPAELYSYTQLNVNIFAGFIIPVYNSGKKGTDSPLGAGQYEVEGSLTPRGTDIGTTSPYKKPVTIRYYSGDGDNKIATNITASVTFTNIQPATPKRVSSDISGSFAQQTMHKPFDYSGLTVRLTYRPEGSTRDTYIDASLSDFIDSGCLTTRFYADEGKTDEITNIGETGLTSKVKVIELVLNYLGTETYPLDGYVGDNIIINRDSLDIPTLDTPDLEYSNGCGVTFNWLKPEQKEQAEFMGVFNAEETRLDVGENPLASFDETTNKVGFNAGGTYLIRLLVKSDAKPEWQWATSSIPTYVSRTSDFIITYTVTVTKGTFEVVLDYGENAAEWRYGENSVKPTVKGKIAGTEYTLDREATADDLENKTLALKYKLYYYDYDGKTYDNMPQYDAIVETPPKNAGTYYVIAVTEENAAYMQSKTMRGAARTVTILPREISVAEPNAPDYKRGESYTVKDFVGKENFPSATNDDGISYSETAKEVLSVTGEPVGGFVHAGTYNVQLAIAAAYAKNYTWATGQTVTGGKVSVEFVINKLSLSFDMTGAEFYYGENKKLADLNFSAQNKVLGNGAEYVDIKKEPTAYYKADKKTPETRDFSEWDAGTYFALYETELQANAATCGELDENGAPIDYNLPFAYAQITVKKAQIAPITFNAPANAIYSGRELTITLTDWSKALVNGDKTKTGGEFLSVEVHGTCFDGVTAIDASKIDINTTAGEVKITDAGAYAVTVTINASFTDNYEWSVPQDDGKIELAEYIIAKKALAQLTDSGDLGKYDGEVHTVAVGGASFEADAMRISAIAGKTLDGKNTAISVTLPESGNAFAVTNAGEYTVTVELPDKFNYEWKKAADEDANHTNDITLTYTLYRQAIQFAWNELTFLYDGKGHAPAPQAIDGITATEVAAGTLTLSAKVYTNAECTAGEAENVTAAETYYVKLYYGGDGAPNFCTESGEPYIKSFTITSAELEAIVFNDDINISGNTITVTYRADEYLFGDFVKNWADYTVGSDCKLIVSVTLSGNTSRMRNVVEGGYTVTVKPDANYEWEHATTEADKKREYTYTVVITPLIVELEWSNDSFTYDGDAKKPTATIKDLATDDIGKVAVTVGKIVELTDGAGTDAGRWTAEATGFTREYKKNYALPSLDSDKQHSFIIKKKEIVKPTSSTNGGTFNGAAQKLNFEVSGANWSEWLASINNEVTATVSGVNTWLNNATVSGGAFTLNSGVFSYTNAGTYTVTFSLIDSNNYCWSGDGNAEDFTFAGKYEYNAAAITVQRMQLTAPALGENRALQIKEPGADRKPEAAFSGSITVNGHTVSYNVEYGKIDEEKEEKYIAGGPFDIRGQYYAKLTVNSDNNYNYEWIENKDDQKGSALEPVNNEYGTIVYNETDGVAVYLHWAITKQLLALTVSMNGYTFGKNGVGGSARELTGEFKAGQITAVNSTQLKIEGIESLIALDSTEHYAITIVFKDSSGNILTADYLENGLPWAAGTYTVNVNITFGLDGKESDYQDRSFEIKDFVVEKRVVDFAWSNTEITYDGNGHMATATVTNAPDRKVAGDATVPALTVTLSDSGYGVDESGYPINVKTDAQGNAIPYNVKISAISDINNYTLDGVNVDGELLIKKFVVAVNGTSVLKHVYGESVTSEEKKWTFVNDFDKATLPATWSDDFVDVQIQDALHNNITNFVNTAAVGNSYRVVPVITNTNNFELNVTEGTFTIVKREITITIKSGVTLSSVYNENLITLDGNIYDVALNSTNVVAGAPAIANDVADSLVFALQVVDASGTAAMKGSSAGNDYRVTLKDVSSVAGYLGNNYTVHFDGVSYSITNAEITAISATGYSAPYDAGEHSVLDGTESATTVDGSAVTWWVAEVSSDEAVESLPEGLVWQKYSDVELKKDAGEWHYFVKAVAANHKDAFFMADGGYTPVTAKINKVVLTVSAALQIFFGEVAPESYGESGYLTDISGLVANFNGAGKMYSVTGFKGNDEALFKSNDEKFGLSGTFSYTAKNESGVSYAAGSAIGEYTFEFNLSSLESKNYTFGNGGGTLTVNALLVSVAIDNKESVYNAARETLTASVTASATSIYDGAIVDIFHKDDLSAIFTLSSAAFTHYANTETGANANTNKVGKYAIVAANGTASANYAITYAGAWADGDQSGKAGVYTLTPAAFTVNESVTAYGETTPEKYDENEHDALSFGADTANGIAAGEAAKTVDSAKYSVFYYLSDTQGETVSWGENGNGAGVLAAMPKFIDAGKYYVHYRIEAENHTAQEFERIVQIEKADNEFKTPFAFEKANVVFGWTDENDFGAVSASAWTYGAYDATNNPNGYLNASSSHRVVSPAMKFNRELPAISVTLEYFASASATGEPVGATTVDANFNEWFAGVFADGKFNAGFYKLTFTAQGTASYNQATSVRIFEVAKKDVTVKVQDAATTYGEEPEYSAAASGLVTNGTTQETLAQFNITPVFAGDYEVGHEKGSAGKAYTASITNQSDYTNAMTNYVVTFDTGTLTVNKRAVTVQIQNKSNHFDLLGKWDGEKYPIEKPDALTFSVTNGTIYGGDIVEGKTIEQGKEYVFNEVQIVFTLVTDAFKHEYCDFSNRTNSAGKYDILLEFLNNYGTDYDITWEKATFVIEKAALDMSITGPYKNEACTDKYTDNDETTYDGLGKHFKATARDNATLVFTPKYYTADKNKILSSAPVNVGDYIVEFISDNNNYESGARDRGFSIYPRTLTVTGSVVNEQPDKVVSGEALAATHYYNGAAYSVTYAFGNRVNNEQVTCSVSYTDKGGNTVSAPTNAGEYTVHIALGAEWSNYTLDKKSETFAISKTVVTNPAANSSVNATYDGDDKIFTVENYNGWTNFAGNKVLSQSVSVKEIVENNGGASRLKYETTMPDYGVSGDYMQTGEYTLTAKNAGIYTVKMSLADTKNYEFADSSKTYFEFAFTIERRHLSVSANRNITVQYGAPFAADSSRVKNVGVTYGIAGVLDVDVAAIIAAERNNGDFSDSGLVYNAADYNNVLGTEAAFVNKTFGVKPSGVIAYNYSVVYNDGIVTVVAREITVTVFGANNGVAEAVRDYTGEADHESTLNNALKTLAALNKFFRADSAADESGKDYGSKAFGKSGDTIESLGLTFEFGNPTNAATYFMNALCGNKNYRVSFVDFKGNTLDGDNRPTYIIKQLALTVKVGSLTVDAFAQSVSVVYGEDATVLYTVRYGGWLTGEGDELGVGTLKSGTATGQIAYASKLNGTGKPYAAYSSHVGESYTVEASGLAFTNYKVTYVSCPLAITPRYITATTFDRVYTEDNSGGAVNYHGGEHGAEHDAEIEFFGVGNSSEVFAPKFERTYSTKSTDANLIGAAPTKVGDYTVTVVISTNGIGANNRDYLFKAGSSDYATEDGNKFVSVSASGDALTLDYSVTQKEISNVRWSGNSEGNAPTYEDGKPEQTNTLTGYIKDVMNISSFTLGGDLSTAPVNPSKYEEHDFNVVIYVYSTGTFRIGLEFNDNAKRNYKWGNGDSVVYFEFRVTAERAEITGFTIKGWTYGEYDAEKNAPKAELTNGVQGEITFTYAWVSNDCPVTDFDPDGQIIANESELIKGLSFSQSVPVNAGYCVVRAYFAGNATLTNRSAYYLFRVSPALVIAPVLDSSASGYEYTGSVLSVQVLNYAASRMRVEESTQGLSVSYDGTLSATNAKSYSVTFALTNPKEYVNYVWGTGATVNSDGNVTLVWTIGKATNSLVWNNNDVTTQYGVPFENKLSATAKFGGSVNYYYANKDDFASASDVTSWNADAPINTGDYWIKAVSASGDNFNADENATGSLNIEKATLYATPSGYATYGETYSQSSASFACAISGTFYYNDTESSVLGNVLEKVTFKKGDIPEKLVVKDGGYAFMLETEHDTDYVKGLSADNYFILAQTGTFTVSPKEVRVWVRGANSFYGDAINESDVSCSLYISDSLAYTDDLSSLGITIAVNAERGDDAGEYAITATASNKNYAVIFSTDKYVIKPLEIRIAIKQDGATYTGEKNILPSASITNIYRADSGDDITSSVAEEEKNFSFVYSGVSNDGEWEHLEGNVSSESPYLAGTYTVTAESSLSGNYKLMGSTGIAFTIEKKQIDAQTEITVESKTYTGEKLASNLTSNELYTVVEHIGDCIEAGTYKVKLQINNFYNVAWAGISADTCELDFVILPASNALKSGTAITLGGWTFGQSANSPQAKTLFGIEADYVFEYYDSSSGKWSTAVPVNAGTHQVRLTVAGTKNYSSFVSEPVEFEIQKASLAAPELTLNESNASFTGSELQSAIRGFDSSVMGLEYSGNSKVLGSNVTVLALNAGEYAVKFIIKDKNNYRWADGVQTDENGNAVRGWTVARMKVARPTANNKNYVVNGKTLVYLPEGFDESIMKIKGNSYSYGGDFTAEIILVDTANYEWEDGTTDTVYIKWHIVGGKTVFVVVVSVLSGLSAVAAAAVAVQVVLHKKKKRAQADAEKSETGGSGDGTGGDAPQESAPAPQANAQGGTVA